MQAARRRIAGPSDPCAYVGTQNEFCVHQTTVWHYFKAWGTDKLASVGKTLANSWANRWSHKSTQGLPHGRRTTTADAETPRDAAAER